MKIRTLLPSLFALACIDRADDLQPLDLQLQPAAAGLEAYAVFDFVDGIAPPADTEFVLDEGLTLIDANDHDWDTAGYDVEESDRWMMAAAVTADRGGDLQVEASWDGGSSAAAVQFEALAGLAIDTSPWRADGGLEIVDLVYQYGGVGPDALYAVSADGAQLIGGGELQVVQGMEGVDGAFDEVSESGEPAEATFSGGVVAVPYGDAVDRGAVAMELLDGSVVWGPGARVISDLSEVDAEWSAALVEGVASWEEEQPPVLFLEIDAPDGAPLLHPSAALYQLSADDEVVQLTVIDGVLNDGSAGCVGEFRYDLAAQPVALTACVGALCFDATLPGEVSRAEWGVADDCPWQ